MDLIDAFTVAEAAAKLNISIVRVRQMIAEGDLSAQRVGQQLFIPRHEVFLQSRLPRQAGRPYDESNAWDVINDVETKRLPFAQLKEGERWYSLRKRAKRLTGSAYANLLTSGRLDGTPHFVGGAHAAAAWGAATRPETPPWDIYIRDVDEAATLSRIGFTKVARDPNVTVHVVNSLNWQKISQRDDDRNVSMVVATLDLADAADRSAEEAWNQLETILLP